MNPLSIASDVWMFVSSKTGIIVVAVGLILSVIAWNKVTSAADHVKIANQDKAITQLQDQNKIDKLNQQLAVSQALTDAANKFAQQALDERNTIEQGDTAAEASSKTHQTQTSDTIKHAQAALSSGDTSTAQKDLDTINTRVKCLTVEFTKKCD